MGLRLVSKLQIAKAVLFGWTLVAAAYASGEQIARVEVGKAAFCVPRDFVAEEVPGWLPRELPRDGFGFYVPRDQIARLIPQRDRLGRQQEFTAYVSSITSASINAQRSVLLERAKGPDAVLKEVTSLQIVFAYESSRGDHWVAWKLPKGTKVSVEALGKVGVPIATCSRPSGSIGNSSWKGSEAVCRRAFDFDGIRVGYSMDAKNLDRYDWLDGRLKETLSRWRCAV